MPPLMAHVKSMTETEQAPAFAEAVRKGIEAAATGRTVPYETVRSWLLSWGTKDELPPPTVRVACRS
jgi:predicted transcriptional regulator